MNKRNLLVNSIFFVLSLMVVASSLLVQIRSGSDLLEEEEERLQSSVIKNLFYFLKEDHKEKAELKATHFYSIDEEEFQFTRPDGLVFNKQGKEIYFESLSAVYKKGHEELQLTDEVELKTQRDVYRADNLYYNGSKSYLRGSGNIDSSLFDPETKDIIDVSSERMTGWLDEERYLFTENVKGKVVRERAYEKSVTYEAQSMEYLKGKSLINLNKDVRMDHNSYRILGGRAEIFLENFNKRLKYYVFYDDVRLTEFGEDSKVEKKAFSERLEGSMAEKSVLLSGSPRVEQGQDIIKGYLITLRENADLIEVDDSQTKIEINKGE